MGELTHKLVCFLALQSGIMQSHANERIGMPDRATAKINLDLAIQEHARLKAVCDLLGGRSREIACQIRDDQKFRYDVWYHLYHMTQETEGSRYSYRCSLIQIIGEYAFHARRFPAPVAAMEP